MTHRALGKIFNNIPVNNFGVILNGLVIQMYPLGKVGLNVGSKNWCIQKYFLINLHLPKVSFQDRDKFKWKLNIGFCMIVPYSLS